MKTYTIGRNAGKTICYSNPEVSGDHAEIVENNGSYTLIDHSTNGTVINGNMVHHASFPIKRGDIILFAGREVLNWNMIPAPQQSGSNVFAILGFIFAFIPFLQVLGIVFSALGIGRAKKTGKLKGLAIAGLILSIVFLVIWVIVYATVWGVAGALDALDYYY
ncbi:MAG: FHA domain-containing protein [Bacteroidales bacterium]|nr:FHA domain-containing protein [Bacteroidales bacterium]